MIITDTVGFIKNLPKNLLEAFKATLEELEDADLLIHVVDLEQPPLSGADGRGGRHPGLPGPPGQAGAAWSSIKRTWWTPDLAALQCRIHQGVAISALDDTTLPPLIARLQERVEELPVPSKTGLPAVTHAPEGLQGD